MKMNKRFSFRATPPAALLLEPVWGSAPRPALDTPAQHSPLSALFSKSWICPCSKRPVVLSGMLTSTYALDGSVCNLIVCKFRYYDWCRLVRMFLHLDHWCGILCFDLQVFYSILFFFNHELCLSVYNVLQPLPRTQQLKQFLKNVIEILEISA